MKKLVYLFAAAAMVLATSCDDSLDSTNYTEKTTATFPETYSDLQQLVTGVYQNLSVVNASPQCSFIYAAQNASDDMFGGGGETDQTMQAYDLIGNYQNNMTQQFYADRYAGIARANNIIGNIDKPSNYPSEAAKNQALGEALILRGFFYYELGSFYGNIPLITSATTEDVPQATPAELWGQILLDFKTAADIMPAGQTAVNGKLVDGHVDKYVAEGLLARAWLFYTGMYGNGTELSDLVSTSYSPLTSVDLPDGTTLTKKDVITYIDDCVDNSGYSLVPTFQNLWAYTNRVTLADGISDPYTDGKGYKWVEDDNAVNPESMFMIKYNSYASWQTTIGYANGYALHFGIRGGQDAANTYPFGQGWGAGPVTPNLYSDWSSAEPSDPRRDATIQKLSELPAYTPSSDWVQGTDYFNKKWAPVYANGSNGYYNFNEYMYDADSWPSATQWNFQLDDLHDLVLLRFADVLLMQSELKEDATGMNKVRARAGLSAVSYSLTALQNERRWELACEGLRWNDIRRWHIAAAALEKQEGQPVIYSGAASTNKASQQIGGYTARYNATAGFFKIPESEIDISNVLKQNPGYENNAGQYSGWREN
ncbi:MAG: RagB/SusD family nutrient uptake outer membrane protein [Bacteroidaceae bacterium]|nr:RagB/SusD family nutrient uptake outer membrane protein [Bacteroidaceae bacterium]